MPVDIDLDELEQGATLASDGSIDLDALEGVQQDKGSRLGQMVLNGLTFGLRPRIQAAIESGAVSGSEYETAKKTQWKRDDAYARKNPILSFVAEAVGAAPTMLIPGLGAGRIAQAATRTGQATQGLSRSARVMRALGVGREIGTVGQEAGALGLKTAAVTGGLSSREGSASGRLEDAALMAPLGYAGGRAISALGTRLAGGAEQLTDMSRTGGNAELGALTALRRGIERDGLTTGQLRQAVLPNMGRSNITDQGRETILRAYSQAINNGSTEAQARAAARQAYAQVSAVAPATADAHVGRALATYQRQNEVPLAIDEVARLAGGSGQNLQWTRRAAQASPNAGREQIANTVFNRQDDILPTVRNRVNETLGDPGFDEYLSALRQRNRQAENQLYGTARSNEQPFNLDRVFDEVQATYAFRGGKARDAMTEASRIMRGDPLPDGTYQRHTLDTYIQSRGQLNDLIEETFKVNPANGSKSSTSATRALMDLKSKMDHEVRSANPNWGVANDVARGGRSAETAMTEAGRMKLSTGDGHTRRILTRVEGIRNRLRELEAVQRRMPSTEVAANIELLQTQLEAYQAGFARVLHTELSKLGDTHDVSKLFLKGGRGTQDGVRRIVDVMFGDEAPAFMDLINRARIATTTHRQHFNSQTTPLREAIDEMKTDNNVAGAVRGLGYLFNPRQAALDLSEAVSNRLNADRNTALLRRYSTMTDNPDQFMTILDELDRYALQRHGAFTNPRLNVYSAPGISGGAFTGAGIQEHRRP